MLAGALRFASTRYRLLAAKQGLWSLLGDEAVLSPCLPWCPGRLGARTVLEGRDAVLNIRPIVCRRCGPDRDGSESGS
jgi:hypothetical protein